MSNVAYIPVEKLIGAEYGTEDENEVSKGECKSGTIFSKHNEYVNERNYGKLTGLEGDNSTKEMPIGGCLTRKHSASYFHSDYI